MNKWGDDEFRKTSNDPYEIWMNRVLNTAEDERDEIIGGVLQLFLYEAAKDYPALRHDMKAAGRLIDQVVAKLEGAGARMAARRDTFGDLQIGGSA